MATLEGQTIVIIGGSAGIGYGVALGSLQSLASKVIIASSSKERVDAAKTKLEAAKGNLKGVVEGGVVDATSLESIKTFCESVGEVDHLVYTSGGQLAVTDFTKADVEGMKSAMDVRLWGAIQAARCTKIKKGGSIVFTIGSVVKKPRPGWSFIATGAGGLDGATRGLAVDLAPVRVNVIAPGVVKTDLWAGMSEEAREKLYENAAQNLLVKHVGTPAEIAEAYLFCMKCGYITGETIHVNGGQMLI